MRTPNEGPVERILLVTMAVAAVTFFHSTASGSWGDIINDGCNNDTCKMIQYYYDCVTKIGVAQKETTCLVCVGQSGRCKNGNNNACKDSGVPRHFSTITVITVCDCIWNPNGRVEATTTYNGPYNNSTVDIYNGC